MKVSDKHDGAFPRKSNNKVPYPLIKKEPNPIYKPIHKHEDITVNDD